MGRRKPCDTLLQEIASKYFALRRRIQIEAPRLDTFELKGVGDSCLLTWSAVGGSRATIHNLVVDQLERKPGSEGQPLEFAIGSSTNLGEVIPQNHYGEVIGTRSNRKCRLTGALVSVPSGLAYFFAAIGRACSADVSFESYEEEIRQGEPIYERLILRDAASSFLPHATTRGGWGARNSTEFAYEGHSIRLTRLSEDPEICSVVFEIRMAEKIGERFRPSLITMLSYFFGDWVRIVAEEQFDSKGRLLKRTLAMEERGGKTRRWVPVSWENPHPDATLRKEGMYLNDMPASFESMLPVFLEQGEKLHLSQVVDYIITSGRVAQDMSIALLSIAFDMLMFHYIKANAVKFDLHVVDAAKFSRVVSNIETCATGLLSQHFSGDQTSRLVGKLKFINDTGNAHKFSEFLRTLDLNLTPEEKKVLKLRNEAIHQGVILKL